MDMNSSAYLVLTKPIAREYSSDDLRNNNLTTRSMQALIIIIILIAVMIKHCKFLSTLILLMTQ